MSRYGELLDGKLKERFEQRLSEPALLDCREEAALAGTMLEELVRLLSKVGEQGKALGVAGVEAVVTMVKEIVSVNKQTAEVLDKIEGMVAVEEVVETVTLAMRRVLTLADVDTHRIEDLIDQVLPELPLKTLSRTVGGDEQQLGGVRRIQLEVLDDGSNRLEKLAVAQRSSKGGAKRSGDNGTTKGGSEY